MSKKTKKAMSMLLVVALIAVIAIGGMLAYLTDRDSEANVFTVGDVKIDLKEDFNESNAILTPGVEIVKKPTILNEGKNDAWVWTTVAVPKALADYVTFVEKNETDWLWDEGKTEKIEGIDYTVYTVLHEKVVEADDETAALFTKVELDSSIDIDPNGDWHTVVAGKAEAVGWNSKDNPIIYVNAFAIQKEEFDSVKKAHNAYYVQWGEEGKLIPISWDGTADKSWYNDTDNEFVIMTAEQLAGFAELVDGGNTFEGKTVKLGKNIDLYAVDENGNRIGFNPIGHSANGKSFKGTFDGQGHKVSNMYQQSDLGAWLYEGEYYGLFAYTNGATIKNVTVADAYISSGRNEAAAVVGNAENTNFSDITVSSSTLIAYNNSAGGVASECYGNCSFTNITVDKDTVIGPLWGTYDVRLGGVVGLVQAGNNVSFKDINVSCKLDAINDVAANYQYWLYRYSGMLIGQVDGVGGVADPTGYVTCENVTVTYGDWVNYHYCEDADLGAGSYNGPGEYKYARVEAGTGTDGIDLSACNHNADESHNVLIVFDQLFGGGQGVKGLKTYPGVTVNYPN